MLADLVPEQARTKYMAVFNLNVRLALLIASLCMTLGAVVSRWVSRRSTASSES